MSIRERLWAQLNAVKLSLQSQNDASAAAAAAGAVTDPSTTATTTTTTSTASTSLATLKKIEELLFARGAGDGEASDAYVELRGELLEVCEHAGDAAVREWLVRTIERAALELLLPLGRPVSLGELDVLVRRLLRDASVRVLCAVVRCATRLFRPLHALLFRSARDAAAEGILAQLAQLRPLIADKGLVHEHDSVRVRTVKFIELAALCYSAPDVPPDYARDLRDTAEELARTLLAYVRATSLVSSAAAAVASLAALVRQRDAAFAEPLVDGLLRLVAEPPPHLTASYIASLHHLIRVLLIALLRRNLAALAGVAHDMLECLANELAVPHSTIRQLAAHYGGGAKRARATADDSRRVRARPAASTQQLLDALPPVHLMPPSLLAALVVGFMNNLPPRPSSVGTTTTMSTTTKPTTTTTTTTQAPLELDAVEALSDDDSAQLAHDAFARILAAEASVVRSGSSALRVQLLARLASLKPLDDASVGALLEHIGADFDQRFELALGWLYSEMHDLARYEPIVHELLRRVDDGALGGVRLVVAAPILPRSVLEHLIDDVALEALYQICVQRPADAEPALAAVLRFAGADDAGVRGEATRIVVAQMLPHEHLAATIVEFASAQFQQAFTAGSTADGDVVERQSALFFALCAQRPALLGAVIDVYTDLDDSKRRVIHGQLAPLVRQIGQSSAALLQVIDAAAGRAPTLAVHVLHTLTERERPERALRDAVEAAYARTKEARLLVPMLAAFDAAAVRRLLPALLMLNKAFIRNMVERLVHREAPYWSPLTPAELLVALHQLDDDSKSVAGAIVALNAAFESRTAITQEAVAVALQQLVAVRGRKPPLLLLRTVLLALQYYPALARFVCTNVLPPLIQTKIWDDAPRWQGFVKCCARTLPRSCSVLVQLPTSIFANILDESSEFVRPMVAYAREARLDDKRIAILTSAAKKLRSNR